MSPVVFIDKGVAHAIRSRCEAHEVEDGGALIGSPDTCDVAAVLFAPANVSRSRSHITFRGADWESDLRRVCESKPGSGWIGFVHSHFGYESLSPGDHAQLARLHDNPRVPKSGILAVLAVKREAGAPLLRGWLSKAPDVLVPVELFEVDDPKGARDRASVNSLQTPTLPRHLLGADNEVRRFEIEIRDLEAAGCRVNANVAERGVEIVLEHPDTRGRLVLIIPAEGWAAPPLVIVEQNDVRGEPVFGPLASILSAWCSAIPLAHLVRYARARGVWPRNPKAVEKPLVGGAP